MQDLIAKMHEIKADTEIDWSLFFYKKRKTTTQNPFLTYSWNTTRRTELKGLVDDIINHMLEKYSKDDYTVSEYTPNNDKYVVDKTNTRGRLISDACFQLYDALINGTEYRKDVGKPKGFIIRGVKNPGLDTQKNYLFIGIGSPVKSYKNTFANESTMRRVAREFINIKPFFDVLICDTDCYLDGTYAQSFFNLTSVHQENMGKTHALIAETNLVINLPEIYPKRGKSVFTDIAKHTNDIGATLSFYLQQKQADPDNEYYRFLKIVDGKFDAGDMDCYLTLIDLLSGRISSSGVWRGEVRPINLTFLSPQTNLHSPSLQKEPAPPLGGV